MKRRRFTREFKLEAVRFGAAASPMRCCITPIAAANTPAAFNQDRDSWATVAFSTPIVLAAVGCGCVSSHNARTEMQDQFASRH